MIIFRSDCCLSVTPSNGYFTFRLLPACLPHPLVSILCSDWWMSSPDSLCSDCWLSATPACVPLVFRLLPVPLVFRLLPVPLVFRLLPVHLVFRLLPVHPVFRLLPVCHALWAPSICPLRPADHVATSVSVPALREVALRGELAA